MWQNRIQSVVIRYNNIGWEEFTGKLGQIVDSGVIWRGCTACDVSVAMATARGAGVGEGHSLPLRRRRSPSPSRYLPFHLLLLIYIKSKQSR